MEEQGPLVKCDSYHVLCLLMQEAERLRAERVERESAAMAEYIGSAAQAATQIAKRLL
jgi:hypothetical protein